MPRTSLKPTVEISAPPADHGLKGLEHVAWLMDRAFHIPGTKITVGLDALLGLLPVGGDVVTGAVQAGIVLIALYRYRVPKAVAARMAANVLLDVVVGAIPLAGDLFDVAFKANTKNIQLLNQVVDQRKQVSEPVASRASLLTISAIAAVLCSRSAWSWSASSPWWPG